MAPADSFRGPILALLVPLNHASFPLQGSPACTQSGRRRTKKATITNEIPKKVSNIIFPLSNSKKCMKRKIKRERLEHLSYLLCNCCGVWMPQVSMRFSTSCGIIGSLSNFFVLSQVARRYRLIDVARAGYTDRGLGRPLHRCWEGNSTTIY